DRPEKRAGAQANPGEDARIVAAHEAHGLPVDPIYDDRRAQRRSAGLTTPVEKIKRVVKRHVVLRRLERNRARLERLSTTRNGRLSERYWDCDVGANGVLSIGGADVGDLMRAYGTPLHVVNFAR